MKTKGLMLLVLALLITAVVLGGCKKKEEPKAAMIEGAKKTAEATAVSIEQTMCPIMDGNKIDKNVFVEYKGKKVYFCCSACKAKFEADPEKYISKLPQFKQ